MSSTEKHNIVGDDVENPSVPRSRLRIHGAALFSGLLKLENYKNFFVLCLLAFYTPLPLHLL
jgi:hypothetical protein